VSNWAEVWEGKGQGSSASGGEDHSGKVKEVEKNETAD